MAKQAKRKKQRQTRVEFKTKLLISDHLGGSSPPDLAEAMGLRFLNQGYEFVKPSFNPRLQTLEKIADGLTKLKGKKVSVKELISD